MKTNGLPCRCETDTRGRAGAKRSGAIVREAWYSTPGDWDQPHERVRTAD